MSLKLVGHTPTADHKPVVSVCSQSTLAITLVALLALGAIVVGILAILASVPNGHGGLSALSHLGLPGGISLLSAGCITLMILSALICYRRYCKPAPQPAIKTKKTPPSPDTLATETPTPSNRHCKPAPQPVVETKKKAPLTTDTLATGTPTHTNHPAVQITQPDLAAWKIEQEQRERENRRLDEIYGNERPEPIRPQLHEPGSERIIANQERLILLYDQEFLNLTVEDIVPLSVYELDIVYLRMAQLESKGVPVVKSEQIVSESITNPTLAQLRAFPCTKAMISSLPPVIHSLLTLHQLEELLSIEEISNEEMQSLFPVTVSVDPAIACEFKAQENYIAHKLTTLKVETVSPHLNRFSCEQLHFLPETYFQQDLIPWDQITTADDLNKLFNIDQSFRAQTVKNVQALPIDRIQALAPLMDVVLLSCFLDTQLLDPRFPWDEFIKKDRVGSQLHYLKPTVLNRAPIDWNEFTKKQTEIDALFNLVTEYKKIETATILKALEFPILNIVAPALQADHILCFKDDQLKDEKFPWADFIIKENLELRMHEWNQDILITQLNRKDFPWTSVIQKPQIGSHMQLWRSDVLAAVPVPWKDLVHNKNEIDVLFSLSHYRVENTKKVLQSLDFPTLSILAPVLTLDHLNYFADDQVLNSQFPWSEFIKKEGIGLQLRNHFQRLIAKLPLPWKELALKKSDIAALFSLSEYIKTNTKEILESLSFPVLQVLAPALQADHIFCFKDDQLKSKEFPWSDFIIKENIELKMDEWNQDILITQLNRKDFPWTSVIQKPQIGSHMQLWRTDVLAAVPVPWKDLVTNKNEIDVLFSLSHYRVENTKKVLQSLDFPTLNILAPVLTLDHLNCFRDDQLEDAQFPWSEFIKKVGIAQKLRHDMRSSIALLSIPWCELAQREKEFDQLFSLSDHTRKNITSEILQSLLGYPALQALAPFLKKEHLECFKPEQLIDVAFPREAFNK